MAHKPLPPFNVVRSSSEERLAPPFQLFVKQCSPISKPLPPDPPPLRRASSAYFLNITSFFERMDADSHRSNSTDSSIQPVPQSLVEPTSFTLHPAEFTHSAPHLPEEKPEAPLLLQPKTYKRPGESQRQQHINETKPTHLTTYKHSEIPSRSSSFSDRSTNGTVTSDSSFEAQNHPPADSYDPDEYTPLTDVFDDLPLSPPPFTPQLLPPMASTFPETELESQLMGRRSPQTPNFEPTNFYNARDSSPTSIHEANSIQHNSQAKALSSLGLDESDITHSPTKRQRHRWSPFANSFHTIKQMSRMSSQRLSDPTGDLASKLPEIISERKENMTEAEVSQHVRHTLRGRAMSDEHSHKKNRSSSVSSATACSEMRLVPAPLFFHRSKTTHGLRRQNTMSATIDRDNKNVSSNASPVLSSSTSKVLDVLPIRAHSLKRSDTVNRHEKPSRPPLLIAHSASSLKRTGTTRRWQGIKTTYSEQFVPQSRRTPGSVFMPQTQPPYREKKITGATKLPSPPSDIPQRQAGWSETDPSLVNSPVYSSARSTPSAKLKKPFKPPSPPFQARNRTLSPPRSRREDNTSLNFSLGRRAVSRAREMAGLNDDERGRERERERLKRSIKLIGEADPRHM